MIDWSFDIRIVHIYHMNTRLSIAYMLAIKCSIQDVLLIKRHLVYLLIVILT